MYIYDKRDNVYLSNVFLNPLLQYGPLSNRQISKVDEIDSIKDSILLVESSLLSSEQILKIKNNNNYLVAFDINDNSALHQNYNLTKESLLIDLIFKFSGIHTTDTTDNLVVDTNFKFSNFPHALPGWEYYKVLRDSKRLVPMPYVPAIKEKDNPIVPFEFKRKTCIIRGGLHYIRFYLYLFLLKHNLIDENSGFNMDMYYKVNFTENMRFCHWCLMKYFSPSGITYFDYKQHPRNCCNQGCQDWQSDNVTNQLLDINDGARWNNKCIPAYYWLAEQWAKVHGKINTRALQTALNMKSNHTVGQFIGNALFYGEYKWIHCINLPQRHWFAAKEKTITLSPKKITTQSYFPEAIEDKHFVTFSNTFEDLPQSMEISKEKYEYISENCFSQYKKWVEPSKFKLNTNLLEYIFRCIEAKQALLESEF